MQKARTTRERIPQSVRFNVFRRDNFTCRYCGRASPQVVLHCDHATSVKDGGGDTEDNLVTACSDCNFGKSSQSVHHQAKPADPTASQQLGLVGMWGHTFTTNDLGEKDIEWQFKIVRQVNADTWMCQLFSWLDGEPTNCTPISTDKILNECKLYASNEMMNQEYEKFCDRLYRSRKVRAVA